MFKEGTPMRLDCITTEITSTFSLLKWVLFLYKKKKSEKLSFSQK